MLPRWLLLASGNGGEDNPILGMKIVSRITSVENESLEISRMKRYHLICLILLALTLSFTPVVLAADNNIAGETNGTFYRFTETPPPMAPVRPVAEFEPATDVLIRYPLGIPVSLVAALSNTAHVFCLVGSTANQNAATTSFNSGGVNMANVSFIIAATDSYWTRDYGPWFVFDGNDDLGVVDMRYNRPRPNDDNVPVTFANLNGLPLFGLNLYQTGGNYMSDGINTVAQTSLAYDENSSLTEAQVNARMLSYMGADNYLVMGDPNNTYINHIDCWGKYLAPDKVLIRSVPTSHAQYNAIEQVTAFFTSHNCSWGYPYKVYRVYTPQNQPYTNSFILNKRVFVPIMNSANDAAALQVYRDAMPGYEVMGFIGAASTPWESTDALHCRTHEIPDKNMLHLFHMPYWGEVSPTRSLLFDVTVKNYSGQPVYPDSTFIRYQIGMGEWQNLSLVNTSGQQWSAQLTNFAPGDTIRYYVHAADMSGHSADQPVFAQLDPHIFVVAPDTEAPVISHAPLTEIQNQPTQFVVDVTDNYGVSQVVMYYQINHGAVQQAAMSPYPEGGANTWNYLFTPQFVPGNTAFSYRFEAIDIADPANIAYYPAPDAWVSVPITGVEVNDEIVALGEIVLLRVFPNPFKASLSANISVEYITRNTTNAVLNIFNIKGQQVAQVSGIPSASGLNKMLWDGRDTQRRPVSPGIYFLQLVCGDNVFNRKMLVLN
jgi:agmatine deiminase